MKRKLKVALISSSLILILTSAVWAASTGAAFLKIGAGARPSALGGNYVGLADDVNAVNWNPGGLGFLQEKELSAMYASWLADMNYEFASYAQPFSSGLVLGGSIVMLQSGEMEKRSETREKLGTFSATDTCGTLALAKKINEKVALGASIKVINQKIDDESTTGMAVDLGALVKTSIDNLNVGIALRNLGPQMKFISEGYDLPLTLAAGINYSLSKINLTSDLNYYDSKMTIGVGMEYKVINALVLDLGYKAGKDDKLDGLAGVSAGLGFNINKINLSYAWVPYGELSDTHRISLGVKF
ncbi:MAG: PorV/PorQ family protein [bacterium]|nr:PorV/PorQ family protein [bacterium]